jgi:catechol-2,3-dioxygenase
LTVERSRRAGEEDPHSRGPIDPGAGIGHVHLKVADIERSLDFWCGVLGFYLDDPDGNGVELYRDRPREQWPTAPDGSLEMYTRPLDLADLATTSPD